MFLCSYMELASERRITGIGYIKASTAEFYNTDTHTYYLYILILPMILIIILFIPSGIFIRLLLVRDKIVIFFISHFSLEKLRNQKKIRLPLF